MNAGYFQIHFLGPYLKALLCSFAFLLGYTALNAQSITNAGTEFWFAFTEPIDGFTTVLNPADPSIVFQANISSSYNTSGYIEVPGSSFYQTFNVSPGSVAKVTIPDSLAWVFTSDSLETKAIHVHTEDDCVLYANTYHLFRSEASLVLPNRALGSEYYAITYFPLIYNFGYQGQIYSGPWLSEFMIVAPGESVTVEITPSGNTRGGHLANVPFTVTLDSGQLYQVQGDSMTDLTGSHVRCTDPNGTVAVFAGNVWALVFCGPNGSRDPTYEAMFPVNSWGREYILIPTPDVGVDEFRVVAEEDDTDIFKDGVLLATIDQGEYYQDTHSLPTLITSNNRISVGQFMVSNQNNCGNISQGDPSMVIINPNEQMFLDSITFFAISEVNITLNHVVIVTRTDDIATLELDGNQVVGFNPLKADSTYSYTSVLIDTGSHNLYSSGCGFLAYSIGLGTAESYSYAAGVRLTDLTAGVEYSNISANSDTICQYDSVRFNVNAIGNPFQYQWKLGDGTTSSQFNPIHSYDSGGTYFIEVIITSQCRIDTVYDTLTVIALPEFSLGADTIVCLKDTLRLTANFDAFSYAWSTGDSSKFIVVDSTDKYYVTVSNGRCLNSDSIEVEFRPTLNGLAITSIDSTDTICEDELMLFTGITTRSVVKWLWRFGDGSTDTSQVITKGYETGGGYTVSLEAIYLCGLDSIYDTIVSTVKITEIPDLDLGPDTFACTDEVILRPKENAEAYEHIWYSVANPDGVTSSELTVYESGTYRVVANNGGCFAEDSIKVDFENEFVIPNVFSPNGDGINDFYRIVATDECYDFNELSIYNRWGTLVFYTKNPLTDAWFGHSTSGEKFPPGVYYYRLSGPDGTFNGSLNLLSE